MNSGARRMAPRRTHTLLFDADGTLFPSEEPAFRASVDVVNAFVRSIGGSGTHTADELRRTTTGLTFRTTAARLAAEAGVDVDPSVLQTWVEREVCVVANALRGVLQPHDDVIRALEQLATRHDLAVVTSSASARLDVCLRAAGLERFFPATARFSAESSLPAPSSKPDPAVYLHALESLAIRADQAIAVEDSVAGTSAAIAAGIVTIGALPFTPANERRRAAARLVRAGATEVVESWTEMPGRVGSVAQVSGLPPVTPITSPEM